jgi:hypothetical protein
MTRPVQSISRCLLRIAEDGMIEFFFSDASTLNGGFCSDGAEFLRREVFQLAAIAPEGRARSADDGNVTWLKHV